MPFKTASISSPGGRKGNEDFAGFLEAGDAGCWIVADGLGFHGGGATASRVAVETVLASFRANPAVSAEAVGEHLQRAHAAIRNGQTTPELSQMKSTAVVLVANQKVAVCGHIGDSRLYHLQASHIAHQTRDHSVPGTLAAGGVIGPRQIRFHEDRNRLLRSLGGESENGPTIETRSLCQGDAFLLCSDGFWEYVNELEMEVDLAKSSTPSEWISFMTARLLQRAQAENDNYTGMGVFFQSPSAPAPSLPPPRTTGGKVRNRADQLTIGVLILLAFSLLVFTGAAVWAKSNVVRGFVQKHLPLSGGSSPSAIQEPVRPPVPAASPSVLTTLPAEKDSPLESEIKKAKPGTTITITGIHNTVDASHMSKSKPKVLTVKGADKKPTCLFVKGEIGKVFAPKSRIARLTLVTEGPIDGQILVENVALATPDQALSQCDLKSLGGANP